MKTKKIKARVKELDIELGRIKIIGKADDGFLLGSHNIEMTVDGKPYQEVLGLVESMDIHFPNAGEAITIDLRLFVKQEKKNAKKK